MYESLTRFIPQLELAKSFGEWVVDREHAGTPDDPIQFPYVAYGQLVTGVRDSIAAFVTDHPELELTRYGEILEENGLVWDAASMEGADVATLDGRAVMALLVGAVRAERFCDGALLRFFESGCIERWLRRLREIDEAAV